MTRQELVVATGHRLSVAAELLLPEASSRRGLVPSLGPDMAGDPLDNRPGPALGGDGETLSRADGVRSYPVDGGRGIHEDDVPVAVLLSLVRNTEGLVDGVDLRVEDFFVRAEVVALSGPPFWCLPHVCSSRHLSAFRGLEPSLQMMSRRLRSCAVWRATALFSVTIWPGGALVSAPLLGLDHLAWAKGGCRPETRSEGHLFRARVSSGLQSSLGLAYSLCVDLAMAWWRSNSVLAGVRPLPAATTPSGVDRKTPRSPHGLSRPCAGGKLRLFA